MNNQISSFLLQIYILGGFQISSLESLKIKKENRSIITFHGCVHPSRFILVAPGLNHQCESLISVSAAVCFPRTVSCHNANCGGPSLPMGQSTVVPPLYKCWAVLGSVRENPKLSKPTDTQQRLTAKVGTVLAFQSLFSLIQLEAHLVILFNSLVFLILFFFSHNNLPNL